MRPLLAGTGATPHRWANAASEVIRSGLSPALVRSWPATSGPTPGRESRSGATVADQLGDLVIGFGDLLAQLLVASGESTQGGLGGLVGVAELVAGTQPGAAGDDLAPSAGDAAARAARVGR